MTNTKNRDVLIIGGSYAGLSAAMSLGRSMRHVLVIDGGMPCNRQTPHSHNFITHDGERPHVIAQKAKEQVLKYDTVNFIQDTAVSAGSEGDNFVVTTQNGDTYTAKKLILATGITDVMPDIKGFAACWGISVVHCPYCHGYEFRNRKTGILANGERAFHLTSLVNNLSHDITILTHEKATFSVEQLAKLDMYKIKIVETPVSEIEHVNGNMKNVILQDGSKLAFDAVYAAIPFVQHTNLSVELGCELTEQGYIKIDAFHKTTVKGVFACGDNSNPMRSVAHAVYAGNFTGAIVNKELTDELF